MRDLNPLNMLNSNGFLLGSTVLKLIEAKFWWNGLSKGGTGISQVSLNSFCKKCIQVLWFGMTWGWVNDDSIFIFVWTFKQISHISVNHSFAAAIQTNSMIARMLLVKYKKILLVHTVHFIHNKREFVFAPPPKTVPNKSQIGITSGISDQHSSGVFLNESMGLN